ncbi:MAG: branched-chain amino acid ABC transporter permease [Pseudomonadota bacterium]
MRFVFKTSYDFDIDLFEDNRHRIRIALLLVVLAALPFLTGEYYLAEAVNTLIWALAGMGLMLLVGHSGQVSLGHAAFLAIGAYTDVALMTAGWPFLPAFLAAGILTGLFGAIVAIPAIRMSGIYLAIATLALFVIVEEIVILAEPITGGIGGIFAPDITIFGIGFGRYTALENFYWLCLAVVVLVTVGYANLLRSPTGRAFMAVRDSEVSARALGINVARTKTLAFGLSCGITGLAGALMAHALTYVNYEAFSLFISINLLLVVTIGGLGFIQGAFLGAILITGLPQLLSILRDLSGIDTSGFPGFETLVFAAILLVFIIYEPMGLYGRWLKTRTFFDLFPLYRRDMFRRQKAYLKTERMR